MSKEVTTFPMLESRSTFARPSLAWITRRKLTLLAFVILVVAASTVRLLTFERYLPYLDHPDEVIAFLVARNWRGLNDSEHFETRYAGKPPAYIAVNVAVQFSVEVLANRVWILIHEYFYAARLLAVFVGVGTVVVIASISWQLAGPVAGWLAGFVWALTPIIVKHNSLALADPFVYFTSAAAISLAIRAWKTESPRWLFGSVIAAILAIYFKSWPVHTLIPWGISALVLARRQPRRILPWLGVQFIVGLMAAAYLLLIYSALELPSTELSRFRNNGLEYMFTPARNFNNWWHAILPIGHIWFFVVVGGAGLAYLYNRRRGRLTLDGRWIGILLLYSTAGILMVSSFIVVGFDQTETIRHVLPISVALIPIWSVGLVQIAWALRGWVQRQQGMVARLLTPAGIAALSVLVLLPGYASGNALLIEQFSSPDIRELLWQWTDTNIPPDGRILIPPNSVLRTTWNRTYSGYDGVKTFLWWHEDVEEIIQSTPRQYADREIIYFVMNEGDQIGFSAIPEMEDFLDQLAPIKTIPSGSDIVGQTVYFYRLLPPQNSTDFSFDNQIILAGYDLTEMPLFPGDTLVIRPYWRAQRQPETNYQMFIHLYPADDVNILSQYDTQPASPQRPTLTWDDPDELYIGQDVPISIPADLEPGNYRLAIGLYDLTTFQRLRDENGADFFAIPITISSN